MINQDSDEFIKSPDEWRPIPGSLEAIARLNHAGWHIVVATNQSGIGRGLFDMATLNAIHDKMHRRSRSRRAHRRGVLLPAHRRTAATAASRSPGCCRRSASASASTDRVPCVGDSLRDLQAAEAVGAQPILVLTGKGERTLREGNFPKNTVIFPDLAFAASALLAAE